jgi:hypothetical protein
MAKPRLYWNRDQTARRAPRTEEDRSRMEVKSLTEQKSLLADLSPGKRTRLRRLLFEFGPG